MTLLLMDQKHKNVIFIDFKKNKKYLNFLLFHKGAI